MQEESLFCALFAYDKWKSWQRYVKPLLDGERTIAAGEAIEKPAADHTLYRIWATNVVRDELHKAGWRLVDILEKVL